MKSTKLRVKEFDEMGFPVFEKDDCGFAIPLSESELEEIRNKRCSIQEISGSYDTRRGGPLYELTRKDSTDL